MADIVSLQELVDAKLDAQSLERFINGDVDEEVLTRLSQQYPSLQNFLFQFQKYNSRAYKTFADMDADKATISAKSKVTVTNDATASNNGDWQWDGTSFTKSFYDPLTQAKAYTDSSINTQNIKQLYSTANNVLNLNVNPADGSLRTVAAAQVNVFPITAGETYTLVSTGFDTTYAKLAVSANNTSTAGSAKTLVALTSVDATTKTFVAPITGYAFLNVKWTPNLDMTTKLSIKSTEFIEVIGMQNKPVRDLLAQSRMDNAKLETVVNAEDLDIFVPELYSTATKSAGFFVGVSGTLTSNSGAELVCFPIKPNHSYLIKSSAFLSTKTVGLSATNTVVNGGAIINRTLQATTDPTIYKFDTTSADSGFLYAFFTTRLDLQTYDVRTTLKIYVDAVVTDESPYIQAINGIRFKSEASESTVETRLTDKKCFAFGDSITEGTGGSIVAWWEQIWGTTVENYGSSGGRASRVVDIAVAGEGLAKRDSATSGTAWPTKDYSNLYCVNLMIGTNDSDGSSFGNIADNPTGRVEDYPTTNDYWNLFPNTYVGNISLFIEFIRWKAPQAEIHITTPPYRNFFNETSELWDQPERITKLIPYLESIARIYGVHLIYGTYECGIGYKHMHPNSIDYSTDGVHFTALGNEIFGKFIAEKTLNFG